MIDSKNHFAPASILGTISQFRSPMGDGERRQELPDTTCRTVSRPASPGAALTPIGVSTAPRNQVMTGAAPGLEEVLDVMTTTFLTAHDSAEQELTKAIRKLTKPEANWFWRLLTNFATLGQAGRINQLARTQLCATVEQYKALISILQQSVTILSTRRSQSNERLVAEVLEQAQITAKDSATREYAHTVRIECLTAEVELLRLENAILKQALMPG